MAWLVRRSSLNPRYCPSFGWRNVPRELLIRLGTDAIPSEEPIPVLTAQRSPEDRKTSRLPDFFGIVGLGIVSEAFKSIVEELEPHTHRFFPVTLLDKKGGILPAGYFVLQIRQSCDAIVPEKSDVHWGDWMTVQTLSGETTKIRTLNLDPDAKHLVVDKAKINGRHLWRGDKHFRIYKFFSDELMRRVKTANLVKLIACKAIEE